MTDDFEQASVPQPDLEEIIADLRGRDDQRRRALDLAWQQLENAQTDQERQAAVSNIGRMLGVYEEFHQQFPEVFPPEEA